jgi:hypothetical protein
MTGDYAPTKYSESIRQLIAQSGPVQNPPDQNPPDQNPNPVQNANPN